MTFMPGPLTFLQYTPPWVFALFALLVVLGVQALRPRIVPAWRMVATPLMFSGWGLITLATRSFESPMLFLAWLVAAAAGLLVAWRTVRLDHLGVDRHRGLVSVPGSHVPLVRNLLIFAVKYVLTAAAAISAANRDSFLLWNFAISGLMAGYFLCWLVRFAFKYRMTAEPATLANS
jgi:hypothetical protein